jgi:hypothetical protein
MSRVRGVLLVSMLVGSAVRGAGGQWDSVEPFAGGAVFLGAQGFARPPITSPVAGVYVHAPVRAALIGGQVAATFAESQGSGATYAIGTVAYARRRTNTVQMYPYLAAGAAAFHAQPTEARWQPAFGGGFGVDALAGAGGHQLMLGARVGYLTRSMADDESIAFAAVGLGFGGRFREREKPRDVVARASRP